MASRIPDAVRLRLTVAYDGTAYTGWQWQASGVSVQAKLEEAAARLFPSGPRFHASSRTDAGVHALGLVTHFDVPGAEWRMPVSKLVLALNAHLPEDIRVLEARLASAGFHARFKATGKEYRYLVWNHAAMNPLLRHQAWHVPQHLDLAAMRAAAPLFVGRQDFRAFTANRGMPLEDAVRTLTRCAIRRQGPLLTFVIAGEGFLYKMCRGIVGTLVQVGQGRIPVDEVRRILASRDRRAAGMTAPAHGLVLWRVTYARSGRRAPKASGGRGTTDAH